MRSPRSSRAIAAAVVICFAGLAPVRANTVNLYAHDETAKSYDEGGNFKPGLYANGDLAGYPAAEPTRAIMEFSLASLPANAVVTSASFSIYAGAVTVPQADLLGFYGYTGDGTVTASDYGAGTLLAQYTSPVVFGDYNSIDATSFVQSLVAADATYAGFVVRNDTTAGTVVNIYTGYLPQYNYYNAPRLTIEYTPAPAAAAVPAPTAAGAGVVLLTGFAAVRQLRRRNRNR